MNAERNNAVNYFAHKSFRIELMMHFYDVLLQQRERCETSRSGLLQLTITRQLKNLGGYEMNDKLNSNNWSWM